MINNKLNKALESRNLSIITAKQFIKNFKELNRKEFIDNLVAVTCLPIQQQRKATQQFMNRYGITSIDFNKAWDKAKERMEKYIANLLNDFSIESNFSFEDPNLDRLKELIEMNFHTTLTDDQQLELDEKIKIVSKYRKKFFFQSSKHAIENDSNKKGFKMDVTTFNTNERFCYFKDIENAKEFLKRDIVEMSNFEEYQVKGEYIFKNIKLHEADRLNRVHLEFGTQTKSLLKAALNLALDKDF